MPDPVRRAPPEDEDRSRRPAAHACASFMMDSEGNISSWNRLAEVLHGYTSEEILGSHVSLLYLKQDIARGKPERELRRAVELGQVDTEGWRLRRDGSRLWAGITITALREDAGGLLGFAHTIWDLTERKRAEEERTRLAAIVTGSSDGVIAKSLDGTILSFNAGAEEIYGYSAIEIVGRSIFVLVPPDRSDEQQSELDRVAAGETIRELDTTRIRKDGTEIEVSLSASPIRNPKGEIIGISTIARDITERKEAERARDSVRMKLRASLEEKEVLLKEMHHRVKNNLQIISSLLNLQADRIADPAALESFRQSQARVRSIALIHEKLYQSKDLAGIEIADYARALSESLRHANDGANRAIDVTVVGSQVRLPIDTAVPCGLLINELVTNCFKHAFPEDGVERACVTVEISRKNGLLTLSVSDNGRGLDRSIDLRHASTMGMQLIDTLAKQIGGETSICTTGGTRIAISFPDTSRPPSGLDPR